MFALLSKEDPKNCELDVRFNRTQLENFSFDRMKDFEDKMKKPVHQSSENSSVSLDQCFQSFREVEKLEAGNEWYCPKCQEHKKADK